MTIKPNHFVMGEECWYDIGEYKMRYLRMAARQPSGKPPLVLVHGLLAYSFSWRNNLEALSADRDVYAMDLLGFGYSDRPPRDAVSYSLTASARRLLDWLRDLGLRGVDLLGTSQGGGVAIVMAALNKEEDTGLISRLILVASINPWSKGGLRRTRVLGNPLGAAWFRVFAPMLNILSTMREMGLKRMYGDPSTITQETQEGYDAPLRMDGSVDYVLGLVRHWHADLRVLGRAIDAISGIPALLIWGSRDRVVPTISATELNKHLKYSELVLMDGIGHLPYEEAPAEFNRIVHEFLERKPESLPIKEPLSTRS